MKKKLVILTGAGMSAESGIATFRDSNGLWEGQNVMEVASPEGFAKNPKLVFEFYNKRRVQLNEVTPNKGHFLLKNLEKQFNVSIITQNVDDLHERAGSTNVLHLHGELRKVRSTQNEKLIYNWTKNLNLGDLCDNGFQLRPHIVWFGEAVPMIDVAIKEVAKADVLVIIGTSMEVYPAAGLIDYCKPNTPIYCIDPNPSISKKNYSNLTIIKAGASKGISELEKQITRV